MNHGMDPLVVAARTREEHMSKSIDRHQRQIDDLAAVLTNHFVCGLNLHDERIVRAHESLQLHRRKLHRLRTEKKRLFEERRCAEQAAVEAEVEAHRQATLRKYGLDRDVEDLRGDNIIRSEQSGPQGGNLNTATTSNMSGRPEPIRSSTINQNDLPKRHASTFEADFLREARKRQIKSERSRLAQGQLPFDPFDPFVINETVTYSWANLTFGQRIHFEALRYAAGAAQVLPAYEGIS